MASNSTDLLLRVNQWLASPPLATPQEELDALRPHLAALANHALSAGQMQSVLEGLHARSYVAIESLLPKLHSVRLPVSPQTRLTVRAMQEVLEHLIRLSLDQVEHPDAHLIKGLGTPTENTLWRIFIALDRQITIADLTASSHLPGVWQNLHRAYLAARRHHVELKTPKGAPYPLQALYARILMLGALPASALSAQEWSIVHLYLLRTSARIELTDTAPDERQETVLWVAPESDSPPLHLLRRAPSDDTLALYVQYGALLAEVDQLARSLSDGSGRIALPPEIPPRLAAIALKHLLDYLAAPKKRRYPRRRQGYRATLCFGLSDITALYTPEDSPLKRTPELSEWMVVNESPGGYAAMHVAGRPAKVQVGDLIALRRNDESHWPICVVRWALSDNPEHLELGLQEISPEARLGFLTTTGEQSDSRPTALLLPPVPPIRTQAAIAFDPAHRPALNKKHVLTVSGENNLFREFTLATEIEASATTEVRLINDCV